MIELSGTPMVNSLVCDGMDDSLSGHGSFHYFDPPVVPCVGSITLPRMKADDAVEAIADVVEGIAKAHAQVSKALATVKARKGGDA